MAVLENNVAQKDYFGMKKLNKNQSKKTLDDKCLQIKILLSQTW